MHIENVIIEKGEKSEYDALKWKKNALYPILNEEGEIKTWVVFRDILKPGYKKLNETRGLVIADYQNFLEKEWISELKKRYQVKVDKTIFKDLKERESK